MAEDLMLEFIEWLKAKRPDLQDVSSCTLPVNTLDAEFSECITRQVAKNIGYQGFCAFCLRKMHPYNYNV